jgi:hypothetical protein
MKPRRPQKLATKIKQGEAARVQQKETAAYNTRGRKRNMAADENDENFNLAGPPKPNRRSSRLNHSEFSTAGTAADGDGVRNPAPPARKLGEGVGRSKHSTKGGGAKRRGRIAATLKGKSTKNVDMARDEDAQADASGGIEEVQDLQRQLQEEKGGLLNSTWMIISCLTIIQIRTGCCAELPWRKPHRH